MRTKVITLNQTGVVNQIYGIIPDLLCEIDNNTTRDKYNKLQAKNEMAILDYLRHDN